MSDNLSDLIRRLLCTIGIHSWGPVKADDREVDEQLQGGLNAIMWKSCIHCKTCKNV